MLRKVWFTTIVLVLLSLPGFAQNEGAIKEYGGDRFLSGKNVIVNQLDIDDLFAVGSMVRIQSNIAGSGYLAARVVNINGSIEGDVFAAGMDVVLDGQISGDMTVAGNTVTINEVGGDLRASGRYLVINGPVSGYAMLAGDEVRLKNVITGNLYLTARVVEFGEGTRVDGRLVIFEEEIGTLQVPSSIASEDRIERRDISEWDNTVSSIPSKMKQSVIKSFLHGALVIVVAASLAAIIIPQTLAQLRLGLFNQPFRSLWFGFLAESVVIGSVIIFAMTLVGLLLIPVSIFIVLVLGFAGYIVAAYSFGVRLVMLLGGPEPNSVGSRVIAAVMGAVFVSAIALIPFFGWLFVLALVLAGGGAITLTLFQPAFYVRKGDANAY